MRRLFYLFNFAVLLLFLFAVILDQNRPWKRYQKNYYGKMINHLKRAGDGSKSAGKESLESQILSFRKMPLYIRQIITPDLGQVDRCVTCHVGMDEFTNPSLKNDFKENPYKSHPEKLSKSHPFTKFGCVVCHEGQGLALTTEDAHGLVKHWEMPILKSPYIESSCLKCHGNFMKLQDTQTVTLGKRLFDKHGCLGCHSVRGVGGSISVDLGDIADKPLSRVDFSHTGLSHEDWNVQNWIEIHLTKDPMEVTPNDPEGKLGEPIAPSGMPPYYKELAPDEAQAITTYLLSMTVRTVPRNYYIYASPEKEPTFTNATERGEYVFQKYGCAACHGIEGKEGRRNFNALGVSQKEMEDGRVPILVKTVGTYTRLELKEKISNGVSSSRVVRFKAKGPPPPLYMPAWKERIRGDELEDLVTYLHSIAEKEEEW